MADGKKPDPPWPTAPVPKDVAVVRPSVPTKWTPDPDKATRPSGVSPRSSGKSPDPTIFVGGVSRPKDAESEVLLLESKRAYVAITAGPKKGGQFSIHGDKMLIGREPPVDLLVEDKAASRRHAQIYKKSGKWYLKDLGSTNGTYLDGPLRGTERILWDGDVFRIGEWEFTFSDTASVRK
jgi:hypothetical protein